MKPTSTTPTTIDRDDQQLPIGQILVGDAATRLADLPDESIDTVITSPPYMNLRDYQVEGQIGLEPSADQYVERLGQVMAEIHRILKPTGSLWLNLGDAYSRSSNHGAPAKSLLLTPEKLLGQLAVEGWLVRNKVVWAKPNPMPHSVRDRLNTTWEPLYLLTKQPHYFFDLDAIRIPAKSRLAGPVIERPGGKYTVQGRTRPAWSGPLAGTNSGLPAMKAQGRIAHVRGKNPGDVWTIATAGYRGAHFATFPEALVERPLRATCPERVCRACGTPWWPSPLPSGPRGSARLRKSCACRSRAWQPGVVLDPFIGAGTVGVVAERLGRRWLGIELKPDYAALAQQRIAAAGLSRAA